MAKKKSSKDTDTLAEDGSHILQEFKISIIKAGEPSLLVIIPYIHIK